MNVTANQVRIAITEDGKLAELFVEAPEKERLVGDVYLGKVARIMPGIKAAFIDIGLRQDAFLHFSDIGSTLDEYSELLEEESEIDTQEEPEETTAAVPAAPPATAVHREPQGRTGRGGNGRELHGRGHDRLEHPERHLQSGQEIIVQVTKEPVGKKGVRVTSEVSLPGRFLVLLPFDGKVGVSKRIGNFKEKSRLRKLVRSILPDGFGAIIRTVADGKDEQTLKNDLDQLISTWKEVEKTVKTEKAPALIYKDMSTTSSVIRDLFSNDVQRVTVDSKRLYREIRTYVNLTSPSLVDKIELYKGKEPVFDVFGVEKEIATAMSRKVWLKSGGYVIIEQTEAMVVVDVNSGRYAAKKEQELNSLQTNLEASREVVRQIRLRDIGGLIVIDFIDLDDEKNRKKVYDELRKEFRKDRAKVTVLPMTEFGLVQITRQRIRQSVLHSFTEPCPTCAGTGLVQSKSSILSHIERWIRRFKSETKEFRLILKVHPTIATHLSEGSLSRLRKMMVKYFVLIKLEADAALAVDEFKFISKKQNKDVTNLYNS
jgi:ribonuclease G